MVDAMDLLRDLPRAAAASAPARLEVRRLPYNLNLLVVFAAVFETRSTTGAAERLRLSQPAISHALARLRRDMDDQLFLRKGHAFVPTPRATELISLVHRLLDDARRIFRTGTFDAATTRRTFRVALDEYATLVLAAGMGRCFREQAPAAGLVIDAVSRQTLPQLRSGELDAVVAGGLPVQSPLKAQALWSDTFAVVVDRAHPLLSGRSGDRSLTLEDYCRCKHVEAGSPASRVRALDSALEKLGRRRDLALATPDYRSALAMVKGSELVLSLPSRAVSLLDTSGLLTVALPFACAPPTCDLISNEGGENDEGLKWFRSFLLATGASGSAACCTYKRGSRRPAADGLNMQSVH